MVRGDTQQTKVHYKGKEDDFVIFAEDINVVKKWRSDKSIPLTDVVQTFKVFVTHKQGKQGQHDAASNLSLDNEFGTHNEDDVIQKILMEGTIQESEFPERQGDTNLANGGKAAH